MQPYYKRMRKHIGHDLLILPAVAARIINKENELLLVRKRDSKIWGLPAGAVESDETATECLVREVKEELNAAVKIISLRGIYTSPSFDYTYPNGDQIHPFTLLFDCELTDKNFEFKASEEIDQMKYFSKDNLPEMLKCCEAKAADSFSQLSSVSLK